MTRFLLAAGLIVGLALPAQAQELAPEALIRKVTGEILAAIKSDKKLAAGDRQKALKLAEEKVLPHVDFDYATRLAVGRAWRQASPEQQQRLIAEFRAMLLRTYTNAIGAYEGQEIKVLASRGKPTDDEATVRNQFLRSGRPPVGVDYRMHRTPLGWKIFDITAEGVSLVITYRSEFSQVVRQEGVEGLIKRLTTKNAPSKAG